MNVRSTSLWSHAFHIAITVGIFASGTTIAWLVWSAPTPPACDYPSALPDWTLLAIGAAAFVIGHLVGNALPDQPPRETPASIAMGRWAMVSVFLGATLIWVFEGIGTSQIAHLEPITYYTRCAIDFDAGFTHLWFTRIAIFGIFLIAGHWFWSDALLSRSPKR